jgi:hypothetical protein
MSEKSSISPFIRNFISRVRKAIRHAEREHVASRAVKAREPQSMTLDR